MVVAQHRLDPLEGLPIDVGRIAVPHHDPPLLPRQARHGHPPIGGPRVAGAAVGESPGVGGVVKHLADRTRGGRRPRDVAARLAPRQVQPARAQAAHHLGRRALFEEAAEDQLHTALHGVVRVLGHRAVVTVPWAPRANPAGSASAKSPRSALLSRPAVRRPRSVCNSTSEIVPFRPKRRRPFAEPGS